MNKILRLYLTILLVMIGYYRVNAVPAYPNRIVVMTDNGKTASIYLQGDEALKFAITEDGYTLLSDAQGWWYAATENSEVTKSPFKLRAPGDESAELQEFKAQCPKGLVPKRSEVHACHHTVRMASDPTPSPVTGQRHALVILMQFRDLRFKKSINDFNALFNEPGYNERGATGSVRDFYHYASQGQLDYVSDIFGPYDAKYAMSHYGGNATVGGNDANAAELCVEAMRNLPPSVDFSQYDNDNDGIIDNVHIIFAGYGEEAGASSDAIWSHEYPHRITVADGITIAGYSCTPELSGHNGSQISNIGVICHELGHALGALDYYDTNYGAGGAFDGTGQWDVMAGGSWNDEGQTPPNFNPYVRTVVFRWQPTETLLPNQHVSMPPVDMDASDKIQIYKLETGVKDDYYLLENRRQSGFDAALPGAGLMIYHVHPSIEQLRLTNAINASHPQGLYPVCASYSDPVNMNYGNVNSGECPFPGSTGRESFTAAIPWNGDSSLMELHNIAEDTDNGEVSFLTTAAESDFPKEPDESPYKVVFADSFETDLADRWSISAIRGSMAWATYRNGDFNIHGNDIPTPSEGNKCFMMYPGKSGNVNISEALSSVIEVDHTKQHVLAFDSYILFDPLEYTDFRIFIIDRQDETCVYTSTEPTSDWAHIELPVTFTADNIRLKLLGETCSGGIFIDNIKLCETENYANIPHITLGYNQETELYTLDGIKLKSIDATRLGKGLYLLKKGNKVIKKLCK